MYRKWIQYTERPYQEYSLSFTERVCGYQVYAQTATTNEQLGFVWLLSKKIFAHKTGGL